MYICVYVCVYMILFYPGSPIQPSTNSLTHPSNHTHTHTNTHSSNALSSVGGGLGGEQRRIRVSSEETVAKVLLDLPQLDWNLNSRQFYITLDVVRNVLLAAPVQTEEEEEEEKVRRKREEERRIAEARARISAVGGKGEMVDPMENLDMSNRADRETLKNLIEQVCM